jgi:hypothetical protein
MSDRQVDIVSSEKKMIAHGYTFDMRYCRA